MILPFELTYYSVLKPLLKPNSCSLSIPKISSMSWQMFRFGLPNMRKFGGIGTVNSGTLWRPNVARKICCGTDLKISGRKMSVSSNNDTNHNNNTRRPGLIVFDLDYTLWPYHVDSTVALPFKTNSSKIFDQSGQEINPFPEVPGVLEFLVKEGYTLAAASRTTKPPGALQLLELLDWNKFFSYKEIYPGSKITHFEKFSEQTKLAYGSMMFFDDEERNIREVSQMGVKCVFVPNGLNMELMKQSIIKFQEGQL